MQHWETWTQFLGISDPAGIARYTETGALVLDTPAFDTEAVMRHYDTAGVGYERLTSHEIRERFPYLSAERFFPPHLPDDPEFWAEAQGELGGFYTQHAGFVDDPTLATHNLWFAASDAGAASRFGATVVDVLRDGSGVTGVQLSDGSVLDAFIVVNAAGPASGRINALARVLAEFQVTTRPMRQEVHSVRGPAEPGGALGPTVGDGDLGTYFRFALGGQVLVGSQEPDCDPLEWLEDPDEYDVQPTQPAFERQALRLARRMPDVHVPNRPTGVVGIYDVTDDWIPIYDKTSLPGYYVAIGTSGNQFKNAPVIGELIAVLIDDWVDGRNHDQSPVGWTLPKTGLSIGLDHYSRLRAPNPESSGTVLG
jgi:sarcosine oxidase subunit beta